MALSKKGSRLITLEETQFRWLISSNAGYSVFVAEKEGIKGKRMEAFFERYKNKFLPAHLIKSPANLVIIKPGDAASIIRQALDLGWNPEEKGSPMTFDLVDFQLFPRQKS